MACTCATSRRCAGRVASLADRPDYVLTDGFPRRRARDVPGLAVWKGDQVAACVAAASVLAKVTRDRLMVELHDRFPLYGFAEHKGYVTPEHRPPCAEHGPCAEHRFSYVNVANASGREGRPPRSRRPVGALVTAEAAAEPLPMERLEPARGYGRRGVRRAASAAGAGGGRWGHGGRSAMSAEDLEKYETEMELQLYREYRDIVRQFSYVVETERRFYLANQVDLHVRNSDGEVYFEVEMHDAWVWDMYRPARFVKNVRVMTFKDVNVEELEKPDISLPADSGFGS